MQRYLRYGAITFVLVILQTTIIPYTSIENVIPDILLVWVVYVAIQLGQIPGMVTGFIVGLIVDLVSGQFLGLSALSKTVAGFLAGYFYNENKVDQTVGSYQFLIITAVASVAHNLIYFGIFVQGSDLGFWTAMLRIGIFSTLYTVAAALFPLFIYSRKIA
jgi:rod shape-determining protein MreD